MERKFKVNNTTYCRSKFGVGKAIGGKIYVHKIYAKRLVDADVYETAKSLLPVGFKYNCIMIDPQNSIIRFDEAPDFNYAREPMVGDFVEINTSTWRIRRSHSDMIWHHKWMWVDDDYKGFDVDEAYRWSQQWTKVIHNPSGSKRVWIKQLNGIDY